MPSLTACIQKHPKPATDIDILVADYGVDRTYVQQMQEKNVQVIIADGAGYHYS